MRGVGWRLQGSLAIASVALAVIAAASAAGGASLAPPFATFNGSETFTSVDTTPGANPTVYTWTSTAKWHLVYPVEGAAPATDQGSSIAMTYNATVKTGSAAATTVCNSSVTFKTANNLNQVLGPITEVGVVKSRQRVSIQVNRPTTYLDSTGEGGTCNTKGAALADPLPGTLPATGVLANTAGVYTGSVPVAAHSAGSKAGPDANYKWNVVVNGVIDFGQPAALYTALGDSYSAGQLPPFLPGGEACARSSLSYALDYDSTANVLACSGATINNVLNDQVPLIPETTQLVTVTAGGNDTTILLQLENCVAGSATLIDCKSQYHFADFSTLGPRLVALYKAIHEKVPKARLYVMGYPNAFPSAPRTECPGLGVGGYLKVYGTDAPYFYGLIQELNRVVKQAAAASGFAHYVEPFSGHDVCSSDSYFMPLDTPSALEKLHPNAAGHAELSHLLREAAGPSPG